MHEVEHHKGSFNTRDCEGDDRIELPGKIVEGGKHRKGRAQEQTKKNHQVNFYGNDVFAHHYQYRRELPAML